LKIENSKTLTGVESNTSEYLIGLCPENGIFRTEFLVSAKAFKSSVGRFKGEGYVN